jgi:soluble lytic murein transglycosylase-like protein
MMSLKGASARRDIARRTGGRVVLAAAVLLCAMRPAITEPTGMAPSAINAPAAPFAAFVAEAARRCGLPQSWIRAVMRAESGGDTRARSAKGAMGLMQIMPATWGDLRARYGLGSDPYDPRDNILAGTAYLREMHDRFGSPGFLAAYNAGPGRYEEFVARGRALPAETRTYLAKLAPIISQAPARGAQIAAVVPNQRLR